MAKNISRNSIFCHILGKIQLVPKENLVEFVTLNILSYTCQIKQIDLYKNVPESYLNALYPKSCRIGLR